MEVSLLSWSLEQKVCYLSWKVSHVINQFLLVDDITTEPKVRAWRNRGKGYRGKGPQLDPCFG